MNHHPQFQKLIVRARHEAPLPAAVVYPCDRDSVQLAFSGEFAGYLAPVLVGPETRIRELAAKAGFKPDDLISFVDGEPIVSIKAFEAYRKTHTRPGTTVRLEVRRGEALQTVELTLGPHPPRPAAPPPPDKK